MLVRLLKRRFVRKGYGLYRERTEEGELQGAGRPIAGSAAGPGMGSVI
jgi:hypothetical protein